MSDHQTNAEARLRKVITALADGIIVVDLHGMVRFVNPAAESLFGRPATELLGAEFGFPVVGEQTTELELLRLHSTPVVVEMQVVEIDWEGMPAYLASLRDVTARKEMERQQRELEREHERARVLREFISAASHDLRTELTVMALSLSTLQNTTNGNDMPRKALESLQNHFSHLEQLLIDMLTLAQLDLDTEFEWETADLNAIVQDAAAALIPQTNARRQQVHLALAPAPVVVWMDSLHLRTALDNLLANACHYTPAEGTIDVGVRLEKEAVVEVRDTGVGIAPEDRPHIFERFFRADRARSTVGSGLGLAIVKKIIEKHRGFIEVESVPGEGSLFRVRLPLAR